jgi:hypothetical protein
MAGLERLLRTRYTGTCKSVTSSFRIFLTVFISLFIIALPFRIYLLGLELCWILRSYVDQCSLALLALTNRLRVHFEDSCHCLELALRYLIVLLGISLDINFEDSFHGRPALQARKPPPSAAFE